MRNRTNKSKTGWLDLSYHNLNYNDAKWIVKYLNQHPEINKVDFSGNFFGPLSAAKFAGCLHVTHLNFSNNLLCDAGALALIRLPKLEAIDLSCNHLSDEALHALAGPMHKFYQLKLLDSKIDIKLNAVSEVDETINVDISDCLRYGNHYIVQLTTTSTKIQFDPFDGKVKETLLPSTVAVKVKNHGSIMRNYPHLNNVFDPFVKGNENSETRLQLQTQVFNEMPPIQNSIIALESKHAPSVLFWQFKQQAYNYCEGDTYGLKTCDNYFTLAGLANYYQQQKFKQDSCFDASHQLQVASLLNHCTLFFHQHADLYDQEALRDYLEAIPK